MKKAISLLLSIALIFALAVPALAAGMTVTLTPSASKVKAGDTFTVTATVSGGADASSVGVTVVLPSGVEFVSGEWLYADTMLKTFDPATMVGAAAFNGAHSPNGSAFVLTLQAKEDTDTAQAVQIGIKLKNGTSDVGNATETATVQVEAEAPVPPVEPTDYTVVIKDDATLAVGETAVVSVVVNGGVYNAIDMALTYDSSLVELTTTSLDGLTLTAGTGTVRVQGYGADRVDGSIAFSLNFKALAPGKADVAFASAKVDAAAHAVAADAPEAAHSEKITITIGGYPVELTDDFTGAGTAEAGKGYTFTAKDKNYDYDFSGSTMGSGAVTVKNNGNGTFTVENVTGEIKIKDTKTPKTFAVSTSGTGKADVTAAASATYGTDYSFTVNKAAGYNYTVTVTVGGKNYAGYTASGNSYTISGADITGAISVSVTKTAQGGGNTTTITIAGVAADEVVGGVTQTAEVGKPFTFELNEEPGYDYEVKVGDTVITPNADGKYTIPAALVKAGGLDVTVAKTPSADTLNVYEYVRLDGKMMYLLTYANSPASGKVPTYDGKDMFWSAKYNAWAALVIDEDEMADTIQAAAGAKLGEAAAATVEISYTGDVNDTKVVDINDAQLVWNMYNARHNDFSLVSVEKFLRADMNGDHRLDTADAVAVLAQII